MNKNKVLSLFLTVCMLMSMLSVFPLNAFADDASITLDAPVTAGDTSITFSVTGEVSGSWVGIYHESHVSNTKVYEDYMEVKNGKAAFPSNQSVRMRYQYWKANGGITAGKYYAILFNSGYGELARTEFEVAENPDAPVVEPTWAKVDKTYFKAGEGVTVHYGKSVYAKDWLAVYPASGSYVDWTYTPDEEGSVTFTKDWTKTPGTYTIRYFENDTQSVKFAEIKVVIASSVLTLEKSDFDVEEPITVYYEGSEYPKDWVAIYDTAGNYQNCYLYTPDESGSVTFKDWAWQKKRGSYVARYLQNDGYTVLYEVPFTVGRTTFSTEKIRYAAGEDITFTYKNSANGKDWLAVYNEAGEYLKSYVYTPDTNGTATFSGQAWQSVPGYYIIKYLENDGYTTSFGEIKIQIVDPDVIDYDGAYYVKAGGTGNGRTADTPAGSVTSVLKQINADGFTTGDYVAVFVIPSDDQFALEAGTSIEGDSLNCVELLSTVHHDARIKYTTYKYDDSQKNYAALALSNQIVPVHNIGIYAQGDEEFENIALIDTRYNYRTDIYAQGWDLSFKNTPRYRVTGETSPHTLIKNGKTALQGGTNRGGTGTSGNGGRVSITGNGSDFDFYFGGYTTGNGHVETFSDGMTFEVNDTTVNGVFLADTGSGRMMTYGKNINLVLNNATVNSFGGSQKAVVGGAIQILLNGTSELKAFTANEVAYNADDENDVPVYIITADADGALDVTETAGTYTAANGKFAYAQSEDNRTVYYGEGGIALPEAGTYTVHFADSLEEVKAEAQKPAAMGAHRIFDSWEETKTGVLTAKYKYVDERESVASYYVKVDGTGDGRTFDTPAGSATAVTESINADGYKAGDLVTVYVIPSVEPSMTVGTTFTLDEYKFVEMNRSVGHTATIKFTTYNYDSETQNYAVMSQANQTGSSNSNINIFAQGPTIYENIITLDTWYAWRTDLNAQGHDLTFKNSPRRRLTKNSDGTLSVIKNAATALYHGVNRNGTGNLGEGGRLTIYDGSEFSTVPYGGYTTSNGNVEVYKNSMTTEVIGTTLAKVDLSGTGEGRTMTYKQNINLVLNGATVNDFAATRTATVEGAVQILLNKGSALKAFTGKGSALDANGATAPLYMLDSANGEGSLDVSDEAGRYYVYGGKIAYTQSADNKYIYYGDETISVPAGTYSVYYADSMEEVTANAAVPAREDAYHVFDKWEDDGNGTVTAVFKYQLPSYYVSESGSDENDGLTAETAFATTTKAIEVLDGSRGVVYCVGNVIFTDKAHEETVIYDSYNGGTIAGADNKISLLGDAEFKADFTAAQSITTNGYALTLSGTVDETQNNYLYAGANGKDQEINLNGKFVFKMVTSANGQKSGDTNVVINGGVLRQMSTGTGVAKDTSYTVASVNVTVLSGEFWCLNHTDDGPHRASGALQLVFNKGSYNFEKNMLLDSYPITNWQDFTPGGTDGFPKIQFELGKWIIRSADTTGSALSASSVPGTFDIIGEKTPYTISSTGLDIYYGVNGKVALPTGIVDVLWTDDFSADNMPKPALSEGYEFKGWEDDGNGHLTAIVANPDFFYVDETGSDDNDGTKEAPFKTIAKAIESFGGANGTVYVVSSAAYDSDAIAQYTGHVTICPADGTAVLSGAEIAVKGGLTLSGMTLTDNSTFYLDGNRLELSDIDASGCELYFVLNGSDSDKLVLPALSGAKVNVAVVEYEKALAKATIVLNGTTVESITSVGTASAVTVLGEKASIGSIENTNASAFTVVLNGSEQETIEGLTASDRLILSNSDLGRVDLANGENNFAIETSSGKVPVLVSKNGNVVSALGEYIEQASPDTWYKTNEYADYIHYRKPLTNTYKKLTEDKELNVVYFGGSVTNGYGSSNSEKYSWRALIGQWLKDNFPNANVTNINRASGESGTYLGTYRLQRDVIAKNPDLLFLEYSINDKYYGSSYDNAKLQVETIVREVREALPDCDIVMVLVTDKNCVEDNRKGKLHTQAQAHEDIAEAYNIPSLLVGMALANSLPENWGSEWSKYAIDGVHLNDAGNNVYYQVIREYMYNSLFCTDQTGRLAPRDVLPAVVSEKLFDGNRTITQPTADLIAKSEALGGSGFTFNSGLGGLYDYYGYAQTSSSDSIFAFEFDGTDAAMYTNFYNESSIAVSVDGGEYVTKTCAYHSPTKIVENLASGHHVIRMKPVYGSASNAPKQMKIVSLFTRDTDKATVKGSTSTYSGSNTYAVRDLAAGTYRVVYDAAKVSDLPIPTPNESSIFVGWNGAEFGDAITENMHFSANYENANDYFDFAGVQIRITTGETQQGLRFVVDKQNSLDEKIDVANFGMVIVPSKLLGDNRKYTDYDPEKPNCTENLVGADKLFIGSTHEVDGNTYRSAEVVAEKIFAVYDGGVRYTTCVTGIESAGYDRYYTLKPFVRYTVNGEEMIAYGDAFRSNTYEVAKAVLADETASEEAKAMAQAVVDSIEKK